MILVGENQAGNEKLQENLSANFNILSVKNMHMGYNIAVKLLPDVILIDHTSLNGNSLKNLQNFKGTHFLKKSLLFLYTKDSLKGEIEKKYYKDVDDVFPCSLSSKEIAIKILERVTSSHTLTSFWKDSFMGLFNLMSNPVVLLQNDKILALNDAFKRTFFIQKSTDAKLSDFVNCKNKTKVSSVLRNFSRGKHMKASTKTSLLVKNNKVRDARISFSKLDRLINDQYIMMIDFLDTKEEPLLNEKVGTKSPMVERYFTENSTATVYNFTKREKEIIELLCSGYKTREISETLCISEKTIEKHRSNIIKRTNSDTILESIIYAINHRLIDLKPS